MRLKKYQVPHFGDLNPKKGRAKSRCVELVLSVEKGLIVCVTAWCFVLVLGICVELKCLSFVFVCIHSPPFSSRFHIYYCSTCDRRLLSLFETNVNQVAFVKMAIPKNDIDLCVSTFVQCNIIKKDGQ